jgi:hypothetical protein
MPNWHWPAYVRPTNHRPTLTGQGTLKEDYGYLDGLVSVLLPEQGHCSIWKLIKGIP